MTCDEDHTRSCFGFSLEVLTSSLQELFMRASCCSPRLWPKPIDWWTALERPVYRRCMAPHRRNVEAPCCYQHLVGSFLTFKESVEYLADLAGSRPAGSDEVSEASKRVTDSYDSMLASLATESSDFGQFVKRIQRLDSLARSPDTSSIRELRTAVTKADLAFS